MQGMSATSRSQKLVYDTHYGVAIGKRMYHNKPPTMLDIPLDAAVGGGRTSPIRATRSSAPRASASPASASAARRVLCALADAVGDDDHPARTPVQPEQIMTCDCKDERIAYEPLTAFI